MDTKLMKKLAKFTDIEESQLESQQFKPDFKDKSLMQRSKSFQIPIFTDEFFKNRKIYISKHNRFADYPKHTHTFLEMNYMLRGNATEVVNNNKIVLHQGDILILDVGSTHSIKALGNHDLLMNIIFRNNIDFSLANLRNLSDKTNIISKFLLANDQYSQYLIYRAKNTEGQVQTITNQIIEEYYNPGEFSNKLLDNYLNALLILLSRNTDLNSSITIKKQLSNLVLYMLKEISQNYQSVSLEALAKKTNYNRSYLGTLFKNETGSPFSKALTDQRLLSAYDLLCSSNLSISSIMIRVGISNRTFFYNKFKEKFHLTPNEVRLQMI